MAIQVWTAGNEWAVPTYTWQSTKKTWRFLHPKDIIFLAFQRKWQERTLTMKLGCQRTIHKEYGLSKKLSWKKLKNKWANKTDKKPIFKNYKPLMTCESFLVVLSNSSLCFDDESWAKGDTQLPWAGPCLASRHWIYSLPLDLYCVFLHSRSLNTFLFFMNQY